MDEMRELIEVEQGVEPPHPCDGCGDFNPHTENCTSNGGCGRKEADDGKHT